MTRWPTRAIFSLTPGPIAATMPQGSWPPITGLGLTGRPPIDSPPDLERRYWCRSLPHIPEALISTTTSSGPGVGSGNSIISISRSPLKTTPRITSSPLTEPDENQPTPFRPLGTTLTKEAAHDLFDEDHSPCPLTSPISNSTAPT